MTSAAANKTLYGLVLAGGKSQRMGTDKAALKWHGKEQRYYMADMLAKVCGGVFLSCRADQTAEVMPGYLTIADSVEAKGPTAGILSAFAHNPNVAWLVVACDLPLLDVAALQYLVARRDEGKIATAYQSPDMLPEPLIAIWEPESLPILQAAVAEGFNCPRKILIRNADYIKLVAAQNADVLLNANTHEDAARVKEILAARV